MRAAKQQWQKTSKQMLESKKPFGLDITPLQPSPVDEKKVVEIAMKFAFQIDSIILNLFTGKIYIANSPHNSITSLNELIFIAI